MLSIKEKEKQNKTKKEERKVKREKKKDLKTKFMIINNILILSVYFSISTSGKRRGKKERKMSGISKQQYQLAGCCSSNQTIQKQQNDSHSNIRN